MALQNRVDPFGAIFRSSARGTMMGNRGGALHNDRREIVRRHKGTRWLICVLEFKGIRRMVMSPGRYTELFFLDEAVALSAGHRPCAECRRERFNAFRTAWGREVRAPEIDGSLHRARIDRAGRQILYEEELPALPDGCFVRIREAAYLVYGDALLLWTPQGYARRVPRLTGPAVVTVLTPEPTVTCLRAGYVPQLHESAALCLG